MRTVDRVMRGMVSGRPLDMARASYAYSRACGLTVREAFAGAWELFWEYRRRADMDRAKMALGFVCFHVWTRAPVLWATGGSPLAMWLLGWAGYYAHAPEARQALTGDEHGGG